MFKKNITCKMCVHWTFGGTICGQSYCKSSIYSNKHPWEAKSPNESRSRCENHSSFSRMMFHNVSLQAREIPGIKIFRSSATIYYTNTEMYLEALQKKVCVISKCIAFALSKMIFVAFLSSLLFHISSLFLMTPHFLYRVVLISGSC